MPRRAWFGRRRLAKKLDRSYFTEPWYKATLDYLLNVSPGDIVHTCDGFNHRIAELEVWWKFSPRGSSGIAVEVRVTDAETGRWHYFPGGG